MLNIAARNLGIERRKLSRMLSDRTNFRSVEIPVPWGVIAGKDWGDPEGHPWLGLHGWLDNCGSLDLIAKDWPAGHRLLAIDFPGHGLSSHKPRGENYHYLEGPAVIERVTRHLNWQTFSLIGHSMGGGMSSVYAALYPEKVDSLIMIDLVRPVVREEDRFLEKTRSSIQELLSLEERFTDLHGKVYSSREDAARRLREGALQLNGENSVTEEASNIILERGVKKAEGGEGWVFTRDLRHRVGSLYGLYEHNCLNIAAAIKCRHLLIKASLSRNYEADESINQTLELYRRNPNFTYRVLEGNHHLHLNTPEVVLPVLHQFINSRLSSL